MKWRKRVENGTKKGGKRESRQGFHSSLFPGPALFRSLFRWISFSFPAGKCVFSLFNTFYISELKREKKSGEKRWEPQKARKKGEKGKREL
jgi:hypothetical protein